LRTSLSRRAVDRRPRLFASILGAEASVSARLRTLSLIAQTVPAALFSGVSWQQRHRARAECATGPVSRFLPLLNRGLGAVVALAAAQRFASFDAWECRTDRPFRIWRKMAVGLPVAPAKTGVLQIRARVRVTWPIRPPELTYAAPRRSERSCAAIPFTASASSSTRSRGMIQPGDSRFPPHGFHSPVERTW
jgi:hypothetical protein